MTEQWTAEIEMTAERARHLVGSQFPQLPLHTVEPLGNGWDNSAFLIDDAYVFRFPRRNVAAALIELELRVLPFVAPHVPVAVPFPEFAGVPSAAYPWPFAGYRVLRGRPLSQSDPAQLPYEALAAALGVFLRELHAIDVTAIPVPGLPGDIIGRLDPARLPAARDRLTQLAAAGWIDNADGYVRALEKHAPNAAAPEGPRCIVHGDLYAANVLVGASGAMTGAIDWGDVHAGDPALDIGGAYEMLPPENVPAFRRAYGRIDERMESTARYRAIYHSAMVGQYGMKIGNGDLLRAGVDGLRFAMAGVAGV